MRNPEPINSSQVLFQSAENLRRSSRDLDALMNSLWEMLEGRTVDIGEITDAGDEGEDGEGGWVTTAYAYNADVWTAPAARAPGQRGRNPRPNRIGTISMIVRICGRGDACANEMDWPWLQQACLIIGWHKVEDYWGLEDFEPENTPYTIHSGSGLWRWEEEEHSNQDSREGYAYFFVIPIFEIKDESSIKELVLKPLKKLFDADDPAKVAEQVLSDLPVLRPLSADH